MSVQTEEIAPPTVSVGNHTTTQNYAWLRKMPLFADVPDEAIRALAGVATQVDTGGPSLIFSDGDPGDKVYFVVSGAVEIFLTNAAKTKIPLEIEKEGDFFGEVGAFQNKKRTATAWAQCKTLALIVPGETLKGILRAHPDILLAMYTRTTGRLGRTSVDLRRTTTVDASELFNQTLSKTENWLGIIADFCGSLKMLCLSVAFVAVWMLIVAAWGKNPLDNDWFNPLALLLTLEAIAITCIVLYSQNLQQKRESFIKQKETQANINTEVVVKQLDEKLNTISSQLRARLPELTNAIPALPPKDDRETTP